MCSFVKSYSYQELLAKEVTLGLQLKDTVLRGGGKIGEGAAATLHTFPAGGPLPLVLDLEASISLYALAAMG